MLEDLLTCVLETFRKESIYSFVLDPSHYLSTPGYSWHVILSVTNVNLKLYQFIESTVLVFVRFVRTMLKLITKS